MRIVRVLGVPALLLTLALTIGAGPAAPSAIASPDSGAHAVNAHGARALNAHAAHAVNAHIASAHLAHAVDAHVGRAHVVGARSISAHNARSATLQLGSHGSAVRSLQSALARLGYLPASGVDGAYGMQTWHAVVAFQGWTGLERDGVAGPRTQAALAHAHRPVPWSWAEGFEIHIPQQVLLLVRGGRVQRAIHVATGRPGWPTPVGHFQVLARYTLSWSVPFQVWMPLAQYFYDGYAMHEYDEVPDYPASHGCVRVPEAEAQTVWNFGRIGMRVWTAP